ncbi:MAG TPA: hypothetical protein VN668_10150 [Stellaceae bacterium]|nr:hypothetical protein [Stellaceae bacterium]
MDKPWGQISEEDLHAYIDGVLDDDRRLAVALFLAKSPKQAARIEAYRAQKEAIRALFGEVADEPLPKRLKRQMLRRLSTRALRRSLPFVAAMSLAALLCTDDALARHLAHLHPAAQLHSEHRLAPPTSRHI